MDQSEAAPPADSVPLTLPGTYATLPASAFREDVLLLRFPFRLEQDQTVCVLFSTREAGGIMAPSLHRVPRGQATNLPLSVGEHVVLAAVARPPDGQDAAWVVAVGDAQTNQWLPGVFRRGSKRAAVCLVHRKLVVLSLKKQNSN